MQLLVKRALARWRNPAIDGRADDQMARILQHLAFRRQLGFAIKMQRIRRIRLSVIALVSIKYQIRREKNERYFRRQSGQKSSEFEIHPPRQPGLLLGIGHIGNGGAMDNQLRLVAGKHAFNRAKVQQIKIRTGQPAHAVARGELPRGLNEIISDQSVRAGDPRKGWFQVMHAAKG